MVYTMARIKNQPNYSIFGFSPIFYFFFFLLNKGKGKTKELKQDTSNKGTNKTKV